MPDVELILALMVVVAVVAAAAHALRLPYSILLVLVGLLLALTPGIPQVAFAPELIFLLFLPPPVYVAGFGISPRDIKAQLRDATALVAYQAALGAAVTASFSPVDVGARMVVAGLGGILVGLAIGLAAVWLRKRLNDAPVEITISLLTPFAAYLPAERLGVSSVLAAVTAGVVVGWFAPRIMHSDTRVRGNAVWDFLVFALNGLISILIGLQLSTVLAGRLTRSVPELLVLTLEIAVVVISVRLAWVFAAAAVTSAFRRVRHGQGAAPHWRETLVVGWSGLRGVVSLAAALALPLSTSGRDELLFITFGVILVTLIGQGLTLRPLTRWLRVGADGSSDREESHARTVAADAAVARLGELATEWPGHMPLIDTLRAQYTHRATHLGEVRSGDEPSDGTSADAAAEQELLEHRLIRRAVIDAERGALLDLRDTGAIDDEVWRRIERDLDLEELRMEA